jgi:hypothetical protein
LGQPLDIFQPGDIGNHSSCRAASSVDLSGCLAELRLVTGAQHDPGAALCGSLGRCEPDTTGCSGDHDDLIFQPFELDLH